MIVTLYLDLDGVLKIPGGDQSEPGRKLWAWDTIRVQRMQDLVLAMPEAEVVLSTSIRHSRSVTELREEITAAGGAQLAQRIVRTTPHNPFNKTGAIRLDIERHEVETYVVIDDDQLTVTPQVRTSSHQGFMPVDAIRVIVSAYRPPKVTIQSETVGTGDFIRRHYAFLLGNRCGQAMVREPSSIVKQSAWLRCCSNVRICVGGPIQQYDDGVEDRIRAAFDAGYGVGKALTAGEINTAVIEHIKNRS